MKILLEQTDEEHPLSIRELIDQLGLYGIAAERKSLYADIERLQEYGINVESRKTTIFNLRCGLSFLDEIQWEPAGAWYSRTGYIWQFLSETIQHQLLETDKPIGLLWKEERLDTFREIIEIRIELCDELSAYFGKQPGNKYLSRSYMVYNKKKILGIVTEKFPITYFRD